MSNQQRYIPRVMDHMPDILAFIEVLIEKGFAYEVAGDVYYRTRKFPNYGKLSHQSIDELEVGASQRTGVEQQLKEDPLDFALWKSAKEDEISWDSPWGKDVPAGILNALSWRQNTWERRLIFTVVDKI